MGVCVYTRACPVLGTDNNTKPSHQKIWNLQKRMEKNSFWDLCKKKVSSWSTKSVKTYTGGGEDRRGEMNSLQ